MMPWFEWISNTSDPVQVGENRLKLVSQALQIKIPGNWGGVIWNRPVTVIVESEDKDPHTIPIQDVTRRMQILAVLAATILTLVVWITSRKTNHVKAGTNV
jgi:hypothetical protein